MTGCNYCCFSAQAAKRLNVRGLVYTEIFVFSSCPRCSNLAPDEPSSSLPLDHASVKSFCLCSCALQQSDIVQPSSLFSHGRPFLKPWSPFVVRTVFSRRKSSYFFIPISTSSFILCRNVCIKSDEASLFFSWNIPCGTKSR